MFVYVCICEKYVCVCVGGWKCRTNESLEENIVHLPTFVEAFASLVLAVDDIQEAPLEGLENLVYLIFRAFPSQSMFQQSAFATCSSLAKLFVALALKGSCLQEFLQRISSVGMLLEVISFLWGL